MVSKETDIQLTVLFAVDVISAWKGESTHRSETSKLPENAPADEMVQSMMETRMERSRPLKRAIVTLSKQSALYGQLGRGG